MHLAAPAGEHHVLAGDVVHAVPVDTIHSVTRPKEPAVAAIALVHQRVAASAALDHGVEVPGGTLAGVVQRDQHLIEDGVG